MCGTAAYISVYVVAAKKKKARVSGLLQQVPAAYTNHPSPHHYGLLGNIFILDFQSFQNSDDADTVEFSRGT